VDTGSCADWVTAIANVGIAIAAICAASLGYRGLNAWRTETIGKRKAELAEQVLADFYEARDVFRFARQPLTWSNEGNTRQKEEGEADADTQRLNTYFAVSERLLKRNECFANLHARQYRFLALFGNDSEQTKPFDDLFRIRNEVFLAVNMLMTSYKQRRLGDPPVDPRLREKWESAIGWREPENDAIARGLDDVVKTIEKICRPAIEETERKSR
jgi:hypothetical protein